MADKVIKIILRQCILLASMPDFYWPLSLKSGTMLKNRESFTYYMFEKLNNKHKMTLMLLQESLWKIEDRINVILESLADHEADIIRIKRLNPQISHRLDVLETQIKELKRREKHG